MSWTITVFGDPTPDGSPVDFYAVYGSAALPPLGPTDEVVAELNTRVREAGLEATYPTIESDLVGIDGVDEVRVRSVDGEVRMIEVPHPTGPFQELLQAWGEAKGLRLRFFHDGSGEEFDVP